jgi:hypothetical protein
MRYVRLDVRKIAVEATEGEVMTLRLWAVLGALLLSFLAAPSGAQAQATRTWVSGVGDDVNPCSRTAPCKTFAGAISKTAVGGEINAIDSGGFGTVTITKSVTIKADGVTGGILASGTNGVIVNAPANSRVTLEGLDIEGVGAGALPGLNGVRILGQGTVVVLNCRIRNFSQAGIVSEPTVAGVPQLLVTDTVISGAPVGIHLKGANPTTATFEGVTIHGSSAAAIKIDAGSGATLSNSSLSGGPVSLLIAAGGNLASYGNNVISNAGTPTMTLSLR